MVQISAQQASSFAKDISGDFNPIHDPGNKSYCVPGDLLFALILAKYGLSRRMRFTFTGMVRDGAELRFPDPPGDQFAITDQKDKSYLQVERHGETSSKACLIEKFIRKVAHENNMSVFEVEGSAVEDKDEFIHNKAVI